MTLVRSRRTRKLSFGKASDRTSRKRCARHEPFAIRNLSKTLTPPSLAWPQQRNRRASRTTSHA